MKNYCSNFLKDFVNTVTEIKCCSGCIDMQKLCKGRNNFEYTKKEVRNLIVNSLKEILYLGRILSKNEEDEELISIAVCYFHEYDLENFFIVCLHIYQRNYQFFYKLTELLNDHLKCVDLEKFDSIEYHTDFDVWNKFKKYTKASEGPKMSFKHWLSLFMTKYEKVRFVEVEDIGNGFYKDSLGFILYMKKEKIIVYQKTDSDGKWRDLYPHEEIMALKLEYTLEN